MKRDSFFIERAREIHGDKYDYSKVEYINSKTKVCIICPEHGEFWQTPGAHLKGQGCPLCKKNTLSKKQRKNTKWFIERAKHIHGNEYCYDKTEYINSHTPLLITCHKHGDFLQKAYVHLNGHGCPECAKEKVGTLKRKPQEEFIVRATHIYGDFYDFSKVKYEKTTEKVEIICRKHGPFFVRPNDFLKGHGCTKCGYESVSSKLKKNTESFLDSAKITHGNKYDYSKTEYVDCGTKVCIICPEHGEFWQKPYEHLVGHGCPECAKIKVAEKQRLSKEEFIKRAREVHGEKYDYSVVEYKDSRTKVCIICPEHGEFWQTPGSHLNGHGCPRCHKWKMECELIELFDTKNIKYEFRKRNFSWLRNKKPLELDFYLPDYNIAIECQGLQHFKSVKHFGGDVGYEYRSSNDKLKAKLCKDHGVTLLYYADYTFDFPVRIINNKEELLKNIIK